MRFFACRMPTASHRGIHQKIIQSGMVITTINIISHSIVIFPSLRTKRVLRLPESLGGASNRSASGFRREAGSRPDILGTKSPQNLFNFDHPEGVSTIL